MVNIPNPKGANTSPLIRNDAPCFYDFTAFFQVLASSAQTSELRNPEKADVTFTKSCKLKLGFATFLEQEEAPTEGRTGSHGTCFGPLASDSAHAHCHGPPVVLRHPDKEGREY